MPLEGLFATMRGIKNVKSESGIGSWQINIEFDRNTDIELARFEVAVSVRRIYFLHLQEKSDNENSQNRKGGGRATAMINTAKKIRVMKEENGR